jgi:hypothetical protein
VRVGGSVKSGVGHIVKGRLCPRGTAAGVLHLIGHGVLAHRVALKPTQGGHLGDREERTRASG